MLALIAVCCAAPALGAGDPPADLYETVRRSTVEVLIDNHLEASGWIADAEGLVVTVAHINAKGKRVEVLLPGPGGERVEAGIVAVDRGRDLLLLRLPKRKEGYPILPLAAKMPPGGSTVFLLGGPIYRHAVMLRGSVARNDATFEYYVNQKQYVEVVHISAVAVRGTSGGPWFDARGEVVGMQSGLMTDGAAPAGVAYAVPVESVRKLLTERRSVETPEAGMAVEEVWQQQRDYLRRLPPGQEGLVVRVLHSGGPAARAGIKEWEVLLEAGGKPLRLPDEFQNIVRAKKPGEELKAKVLKPGDGGTREVLIHLGKIED